MNLPAISSTEFLKPAPLAKFKDLVIEFLAQRQQHLSLQANMKTAHKPTHPPFARMVVDAIDEMGDHHASMPMLKKHLSTKYTVRNKGTVNYGAVRYQCGALRVVLSPPRRMGDSGIVGTRLGRFCTLGAGLNCLMGICEGVWSAYCLLRHGSLALPA